MHNVSNKSSQDTQALRNIADLQKRMAFLEDLLIPAKETLTLEEAAVFLGMKRSTLYKMTHEHTIPFYRPNGKMIYFEKSDLLEWVRQNREDSNAEIAEEARIHMQRLGMKSAQAGR